MHRGGLLKQMHSAMLVIHYDAKHWHGREDSPRSSAACPRDVSRLPRQRVPQDLLDHHVSQQATLPPVTQG